MKWTENIKSSKRVLIFASISASTASALGVAVSYFLNPIDFKSLVPPTPPVSSSLVVQDIVKDDVSLVSDSPTLKKARLLNDEYSRYLSQYGYSSNPTNRKNAYTQLIHQKLQYVASKQNYLNSYSYYFHDYNERYSKLAEEYRNWYDTLTKVDQIIKEEQENLQKR